MLRNQKKAVLIIQEGRKVNLVETNFIDSYIQDTTHYGEATDLAAFIEERGVDTIHSILEYYKVLCDGKPRPKQKLRRQQSLNQWSNGQPTKNHQLSSYCSNIQDRYNSDYTANKQNSDSIFVFLVDTTVFDTNTSVNSNGSHVAPQRYL